MAQTKDGDLWCATEEKGLACVNRQNILTKYPFPQKLRCIAVADSLLWMATDKGELLSFCPQNEEVRNHNTTCGIMAIKSIVLPLIPWDIYGLSLVRQLKNSTPKMELTVPFLPLIRISTSISSCHKPYVQAPMGACISGGYQAS